MKRQQRQPRGHSLEGLARRRRPFHPRVSPSACRASKSLSERSKSVVDLMKEGRQQMLLRIFVESSPEDPVDLSGKLHFGTPTLELGSHRGSYGTSELRGRR